MKGGKYTKTLAKIQARKMFRVRDIKKICFTQIYRNLYGDGMLVPTLMSSNMADGNQQKHLLPRFVTKGQCEFIPRGTHKH